MLTKAQIQLIQALQQKKQRQKEGLFVAEGTKIVAEVLQSDYEVHSIYATSDWLEKNSKLFHSADTRLTAVTEAEIKKISSLITPNEVVCILKIMENHLDVKLLKSKLSLALDDIQDPGNLGTILRIADWFGIENILCSLQTVDVHNSKVIQASMGSFLRTKVFYVDLKVAFNQAAKNELSIYGAVINGENIYKTQLSSSGIITLGNESKGISENLMAAVTNKISIPSFSSDKIDSLNVSIAAAILCSEFMRKLQ